MERKCWYFYTSFNHKSSRVYYATWYGKHPEKSKVYKDLHNHLNRNYGQQPVGERKLTGIGYTNAPDDINDYTSDRYIIPKLAA